MQRVGLGTWQANDEEEYIEALRCAVEDCGYRLIDGAAIYGNEKVTGKALKKIFENGKVKREDLFITSKCWIANTKPGACEAACRQSLADLQIDYLDLYLIHWPATIEGDFFSGNFTIDQTSIVSKWLPMEDLKRKGLVREIGVSNFTINHLEKLRVSPEVTIQPFANQVEYHLYNQQKAMREYCEKRGIYMTGYTCLGAAAEHPDMPAVLKNEKLNAIAKKLGKPVAAVELKFLLQLSPITQVLAKSVRKQRLIENIQLDFEIPEEDMRELEKEDRIFRYWDPIKWFKCDLFGEGY